MVQPVELKARGTAAREAAVAEHLFLHALEDPGVRVVARRGRTAIGIADKESLAGKADAAQNIGRPVTAPPQPAIGAVEGVIVFAGFRRPGADAALGATHFDG